MSISDDRASLTSRTARDKLAERQRDLVTALVAGGEVPVGLDRGRFELQALVLLRKRFQAVARHRPDLATLLGPDMWPIFQRYTASIPDPPGSAFDDAVQFARHVGN